MRFRTSIANVPTFFRIVQAIEKLQKRLIIKFTPTEMHIICNNGANEGGIQVWSALKISALFTDYRIQSNAENVITIALQAEGLLAALKSASGDAEGVTMKLAKKRDAAVLSFEIGSTAGTGRRPVRVAHDVRIDVLKPADVELLKEPMCPDPDANIVLPPLLKVRTVVERLRPLADVLAIRADGSGHFSLSISTDTVQLEAKWAGCTNLSQSLSASQEVERRDDSDEEEKDPHRTFSVIVSVRSFLKFLNSHAVSVTTIAAICQNHCVILYVYIGDVADSGGVLTFYIPAIVDDEMLA